jgi:hypothetical protein
LTAAPILPLQEDDLYEEERGKLEDTTGPQQNASKRDIKTVDLHDVHIHNANDVHLQGKFHPNCARNKQAENPARKTRPTARHSRTCFSTVLIGCAKAVKCASLLLIEGQFVFVVSSGCRIVVQFFLTSGPLHVQRSERMEIGKPVHY